MPGTGIEAERRLFGEVELFKFSSRGLSWMKLPGRSQIVHSRGKLPKAPAAQTACDQIENFVLQSGEQLVIQ